MNIKMQRGKKMISYFEALKIINKKIKELNKIEERNIIEADKYICAENIYADINLPSFNKSIRDGFAVKTNQIKLNQKYKIIGDISAGSKIEKIKKPLENQAYTIMTGAEIPSWADAVIQFEDAIINNEFVIFKKLPEKNQFIIRKGSYIKENQLLIKKGTEINKFNIYSILSAGKTRIKVNKKPEISLIITGDEIVEITKKPINSQVRDINSFLLKFLIKQNNLKLKYFKREKDNKENIKNSILKGLESSEIILVVGGVSMGKYDFVHIVIKELCKEILFHKIFIKPGKPIIIGKYKEDKIIIGIPGNPLASLVNFEIIIKPLIKKMSGYKEINPNFCYAKLLEEYKKTDDRLEFVPSIFFSKDNENYLKPINFIDSGDVISITKANSIGIFEGRKNSIIKKEKKIKLIYSGE